MDTHVTLKTWIKPEGAKHAKESLRKESGKQEQQNDKLKK
jgi:hypothetical protein